MASFDGGFGSAYLARQVGQKRAREIFFLGAEYNAQEAFEMGMVNKVVPHAELEQVAYDWAQEIMTKNARNLRGSARLGKPSCSRQNAQGGNRIWP